MRNSLTDRNGNNFEAFRQQITSESQVNHQFKIRICKNGDRIKPDGSDKLIFMPNKRVNTNCISVLVFGSTSLEVQGFENKVL